ncbi:MAG: hypothetical protein AAGG81_06065 [Chlamydiota bacterium]
MELNNALEKAKSYSELNDIFENNVDVKLGFLNDEVSVTGYEGTVTTDYIARRIMDLYKQPAKSDEESRKLASLLEDKVFLPLKDLVEAPENHCSLYQVSALARVIWTPPPAQQFGHSIALKHAMVLRVLERAYFF